jgi:hypothetical protein
MKSVWKCTLQAQTKQVITLPLNSRILSAKEQYEEIVLYALVDPREKGIEDIEVIVLGTGHEIADETIKDYIFIDTIKMSAGHLMFHVFYKQSDL